MSCALGFDVGRKRIGVAIGHPLTGLARPLDVLTMRDGTPDWTRLDAHVADWSPAALVVGLPLTLDGGEQPASRLARRIAENMAARYALPVALVDERHSSREAAVRFAAQRAQGLRRRRDAERIDADAAAVILERWLATAPADSPALAPKATP